jgi:hypothetical protein
MTQPWLALGIVLWGPAISLMGQDTQHSVPYDWSQRHVVFPAADSEGRRAEIEKDPRFHHQQLRRNFSQFDLEFHGAPPKRDQFQRDWREAVGTSPYVNSLIGLEYPAKYSFDATNPTPDCVKDYIVYTLRISSATDFNVIAFNNLYVNNLGTGVCPGTAPTVLFAYNASQNGGVIANSAALSLDGTQIAFIENAPSSQFHILKWRAGDKSATFPNPFNSSVLADCAPNGAPLPCEYSVTYTSSPSSLSNPFIDYTSDTAWVTDNSGHVSAIHPVFTATLTNPPQVVAGYPLAPSTGALTAPVFDSVSGNVFVSDGTKLYYIRTKSTSAGTCASGSPPCVGSSSQTISTGEGAGLALEAPIVDSTNGWVFMFAWSGPPYNGATIVQSNTTLSMQNVAKISGGTGGSTPTIMYSGIFDNAYYLNPASGKLYACGENNAGHFGTLWAAGFTSAGMNTGTAGFGPLNLTTTSGSSSDSPVCSPLTEVYNQTAGKDYLFTGVAANCAFGGASTGCIFAFDITNSFPSTAAANFASPGGSSGIVIDNISGSLTSATNMYYLSAAPLGSGAPCSVYTGGTNTTGNCAVRLTQSGLN